MAVTVISGVAHSDHNVKIDRFVRYVDTLTGAPEYVPIDRAIGAARCSVTDLNPAQLAEAEKVARKLFIPRSELVVEKW